MTRRLFSTIYLDMDGVLADFHGSALAAHGVKETHRDQWPTPGQDLQERLGLGMHDHSSTSNERFWGPINLIQDFWINLEPFPWLKDLISLCDQYVSGTHGVVICSSPASSWNGEDKRQKLNWLDKHEIYREVKFETHKASLSKPGTLLIDDWEKQVDPFNQGEGKAILVPQPWNSNYVYSQVTLSYVQFQLEYLSRS